MGSRAVQYRPPRYAVDAGQQTYLVESLQAVKDPSRMPRVVGGPDWLPASSKLGKTFRVAAQQGATMRQGEDLASGAVAVLAKDTLVEVVDASADEARVRVECQYGEGWVSAKCLLPFSEEHVEAGCTTAPRAVPNNHADWVREELGRDRDVDAATLAKLDALKARPASAQKIFRPE